MLAPQFLILLRASGYLVTTPALSAEERCRSCHPVRSSASLARSHFTISVQPSNDAAWRALPCSPFRASTLALFARSSCTISVGPLDDVASEHIRVHLSLGSLRSRVR